MMGTQQQKSEAERTEPRPDAAWVVFPVPGDNRIRVPTPAPSPYSGIGQITSTFQPGSFGVPVNSGPVRCTGTGTVFDQTGLYVITAAHNFVARDNSENPAAQRNWQSATFQLAGGAPLRISAVQLVYPELYLTHLVPPDPVLRVNEVTSYCYDLAVARLEQPVAPSPFNFGGETPSQLDWSVPWPLVPALGPAPVLPGGPPWAPQVTGYPGDKPAGSMWTAGGSAAGGNLPITLDPSGLLLYKVATFSGQSGGPVWGSAPNRPYPTQIGVHLGAARDQQGAVVTNVAKWLGADAHQAVMEAIDDLGGA